MSQRWRAERGRTKAIPSLPPGHQCPSFGHFGYQHLKMELGIERLGRGSGTDERSWRGVKKVPIASSR